MIEKRCPKCGSANFALELKVTGYLLYIVENGKVIPNGCDMDAGSVLSTRCYCDDCGHAWSPRQCNFIVDGDS